MRRDRSSLRIRISSQPFADCVVSVGKLSGGLLQRRDIGADGGFELNHLGAVKFSKVTRQVPGHNSSDIGPGSKSRAPLCAAAD